MKIIATIIAILIWTFVGFQVYSYLVDVNQRIKYEDRV